MLDLAKPPYAEYVALLQELRRSDDLRDLVAFDERRETRRGTFDGNQEARARLAHILLLEATERDLELARFLLDAEITARRKDSFQGAGDALTILSLLVLEYGDLTDVARFWRAKRANFDTWAGGYDAAFVFARGTPEAALALLEKELPASERELLGKLAVDGIVAELGSWRESMQRRFPRRRADMTPGDLEAWADVFGDVEGLARHGLQNASTPQERARLYRRLGRFARAVEQWRAAVELAETPWDRVALLRDLITDAAEVPLAVVDAVETIDRLRCEIEGWPRVGLGRMATQACYELAAALDDGDAGRQVWLTAERWRRELTSFPLAGLEVAAAAAEKWGSSADREALGAAVEAENRRIYDQLN